MNSKKALLCKAFFLLLVPLARAQRIEIVSPRPGDPLDHQQTVVVAVHEMQVTRVELQLDDRIVAARSQPPFTFKIQWNPQLNQELKAVARLKDGSAVETRVAFHGIVVDMTEDVKSVIIFPFVQGTEEPVFKLGRGRLDLGPARSLNIDDFPLKLVVVVDISGSMAPHRDDLAAGLWRLIQLFYPQSLTELVVFDREPRVARLDAMHSEADVLSLFRSRGQSVIWDSLAASAELFGRSPRRVVVLVSDGADDGSRVGLEAVRGQYRERGVVLCWLKARDFENKSLEHLALDSGGFSLAGYDMDTWNTLSERLRHQRVLALDNLTSPFKVKAEGVRIWYPRWLSP